MEVHLLTLKVGFLSFWGLWLSIVFITNLFEGLKLLRIVPPYWRFASQNYQAIAQATGTYRAAPWIPKFLFLGVLCWQCGTLALFARAIITTSTDVILRLGPINEAFAASLGLLAAFMIADEVFKQYEVERAHVLFFIAQLVTLLAIDLLPS